MRKRLRGILPRSNEKMRKYALGWMSLTALAMTRCGGGSSNTGPTLDAQYQQAMQITSPDAKVIKLLEVAGKQKTAGDTGGANKSLASASLAAGQIADPASRANALNGVAYEQVKFNASTEAKDTLKAVRDTIKEIESAQAKVPNLVDMSVSYARLGNADAAKAYLEEAESDAGGISETRYRVDALLRVSIGYFRCELPAESERVMSTTRELAATIADHRHRSDALAEIGDALRKMSSPDAPVVLDEAKAAADQIDDNLSKAFALVNLGSKQAGAQNYAAAKALLDAAEELSGKVDASISGELRDDINQVRQRMQ